MDENEEILSHLQSLDRMGQVGTEGGINGIVLDHETTRVTVFDGDVVHDKILLLLKGATNHTLAIDDIFSALGISTVRYSRKAFYRLVTKMSKSGLVDRIDVQPGEDAQSRRYIRCLRLLKSPSSSSPKKLPRAGPPLQKHIGFSNDDDMVVKGDPGQSVPRGAGEILASSMRSGADPDAADAPRAPPPVAMRLDLPLEHQIYQLVAASGEKGLVYDEIGAELGGMYRRIVIKTVEHLSEPKKPKKSKSSTPKPGFPLLIANENSGRKLQSRVLAVPTYFGAGRREAASGERSILTMLGAFAKPKAPSKTTVVDAYVGMTSSEQLANPFRSANQSMCQGTMDKRTVQRAGDAMVADELASMHSFFVRTLRGTAQLKTILLRKGLSASSAVVAKFIEETASLPFLGQKSAPKRVKRDDAQVVERLPYSGKQGDPDGAGSVNEGANDNRECSMLEDDSGLKAGADLESSRSGVIGESHAQPIQPRGSELGTEGQGISERRGVKENLQNELDTKEKWREVALKYGYVDAKILRARMLYEWLFFNIVSPQSASPPRAVAGDEDEQDGGSVGDSVILDDSAAAPRPAAALPSRLLNTMYIFKELPFDLFLKIAGCTSESPEVDGFLERPDYATTRIDNLRGPLRDIVFGPRLRKAISLEMHVLCILGLVRVADSDGTPDPDTEAEWLKGSPQLPLYFRIEQHVALMDYLTEKPLFLRRMEMRTMAEINAYWMRLETRCLAHASHISRSKRAQALAARLDAAGSRHPDADFDEFSDAYDAHEADLYPATVPRTPSGAISRASIPEKYHFLFSPRNWRISFVFTDAQRRVLASHVDRATGRTPLCNDAVCRQLAYETGLTLPRIKYFFRKQEDAFASQNSTIELKRPIKRIRRARQRLRGADRQPPAEMILSQVVDTDPTYDDAATSGAGSDSHFDSFTESDLAFERERAVRALYGRRYRLRRAWHASQPQPLGRWTRRSGKHAGASQSANVVPHADGDASRPPSKAVRRKRSTWTPEEDEDLIFAYIIVAKSFQNARVSWAPVFALFEPNKTFDACRRRFALLRRSPQVADRLRRLGNKWPALYDEGIKNGLFESQVNVRPHEFDISKLVPYFRKVVKENPELIYSIGGSTFLLPATYDALKRDFVFEDPDSTIAKEFQVPMEDGLQFCSSTRMRLAVMYASPITTRCNQPSACDFSVQPPLPLQHAPRHGSTLRHELASLETAPRGAVDAIELGKLRSIIKSALLTSTSVFNFRQTKMMLLQFPHDSVLRAIQSLSEEMIIARSAGNMDHRLPGRQYHFSVRFMSAITGPFPKRMIRQADAAGQMLGADLMRGPVTFDPASEGPLVAALFSLVAAGKARLEVVPEGGGAPAQARGPKLNEVDIRALVAEACGADDGAEMEHLLRAFDYIHAGGQAGRTVAELESQFPDAGRVVSLLQSIQVRPTVSAISKVGFQTWHYVSFEFAHRWHLPIKATLQSQNQKAPSPEVDMTAALAPEPLVATHLAENEDQVVYKPSRMWTRVDGHRFDGAWMACLDVVLRVIVSKPGIMQVRLAFLPTNARMMIEQSCLCRELAAAMTPVELDEILDELVARNACTRQRFACRQPLTNVFDGLFGAGGLSEPMLQRCDDTYIASNRTTAYFPSVDWFEKLRK
nr:RNA polymerase III transcription initiation factor complex subunit [Polyrhizophydium stewartii]